MRRFLLDTGKANDYGHRVGNTYSRGRARRSLGDDLGICTPVLGELWFGVEASNNPARNGLRLAPTMTDWKIWPYTTVAAQQFGRLSAFLRRTGRPMQQIDIQIAAIALTMGNCTVVTKDSDFRAIPGLTIEDWSTP